MNCEKCQQNFIEANKWREKAIQLKDALEHLRYCCSKQDFQSGYPNAMDEAYEALEAFKK
jgi:hypothetical protein